MFSRSTESFGPLFAERALTIGKGKLGFGATYLHSTYDAFEGRNLHDGDTAFFLQHRDIDRDGSHLNPFFEGDSIQGNLFLDLTTDTTVLLRQLRRDGQARHRLRRCRTCASRWMRAMHYQDHPRSPRSPSPFILHTFPSGIDRRPGARPY